PRIRPAAIAFGQGAPLDPGPATDINFSLSADMEPTDTFSISLSYERSSLKRDDTHRLAYVSNILSYRSTYQFSRFVNLKARVDYDTLSHRIFGQYTFAWTP